MDNTLKKLIFAHLYELCRALNGVNGAISDADDTIGDAANNGTLDEIRDAYADLVQVSNNAYKVLDALQLAREYGEYRDERDDFNDDNIKADDLND